MNFACPVRGRFLLVVAALAVAACGGGGGGGGSGSGSGSGQPATPPSKLFAADSGNYGIGSLANSNPSPGAIVVDRIIFGSNTNITNRVVPSMASDATRDLLYFTNQSAVYVYPNASTASGNIAPRTLYSGGLDISSLALDSAGDRLYVADYTAGVKIFDSASSAVTVDPSRTLTGTFPTGFTLRSIAIDSVRDILYVVSIVTSTDAIAILVFDGASKVDGAVAPDRTITFGASSDCSIVLDAANDRIYASGVNAGGVAVLDSASTQNGTATVSRLVNFGPTGAVPMALADDRLYAAAQFALIIVPNVSTAPDGTLLGTAILAPTNGKISAVAVNP
jgi:large repetitive protein